MEKMEIEGVTRYLTVTTSHSPVDGTVRKVAMTLPRVKWLERGAEKPVEPRKKLARDFLPPPPKIEYSEVPRRFGQTTKTKSSRGADGLTPGERRVAQLMDAGLDNMTIARALGVTGGTVRALKTRVNDIRADMVSRQIGARRGSPG